MKLKIVGNVTRDTIYLQNGGVIERDGGICNILRNIHVSCDIHPTDAAAAMIFIDHGVKDSYVSWDRKIKNRDYRSSFWAHISYLDCLDVNLEAINSQIISADLCQPDYSYHERLALLDQLKHVNWLIVDQQSLDALKKPPRVQSGIIVRTDQFVTVYRDGAKHEYPNRFIKVDNPVGAGDAFVAEFLNQVSQRGYPRLNEARMIHACVESSIAYLRRQNAR